MLQSKAFKYSFPLYRVSYENLNFLRVADESKLIKNSITQTSLSNTTIFIFARC